MSHHYKALILKCMDPRLAKAVNGYLEEQGLLGDCDIVSVAGAVKGLISPQYPSDKDYLLRQIGFGVTLHSIEEVVLLNHTDCGAYGGSGKFNCLEDEFDFHKKELETAREEVLKKYPHLKVRMTIAKVKDDGEVNFEELV